MSKIKIIEKSDTTTFRDMPLCYRISLKPIFNNKKYVLELTREYFRTGFRDGEDWDKIFWDMNMWSSKEGIAYASLITKNFDKGYLRRTEQMMIKRFMVKCQESADLVEEKRKKENIRMMKKRDSYLEILDNLDPLFRKEKIKKVIENLKKQEEI